MTAGRPAYLYYTETPRVFYGNFMKVSWNVMEFYGFPWKLQRKQYSIKVVMGFYINFPWSAMLVMVYRGIPLGFHGNVMVT